MGVCLSRISRGQMLLLEAIAVIQPVQVVNAGSNNLIGC